MTTLLKPINRIRDFRHDARKRELFFLIVYLLWFTLDYIYSLELSEYEIGRNTCYLYLQRPIKYLMIFLCAFFLQFKDGKSICESAICIVILVFSFLMARKSSFYDIFYSFLIVCAAREINTKRIVRITGLFLLGYLLLTFAACRLGYLKNVVFERAGNIRNGFGFQYPTHLSARILLLFLCLSYAVKKKNQWIVYPCGFLMAFFIWKYQNTRVSSLCILLMMVFLLFSCVFEKLDRKTQKILLYLLVFGALAANLFMVFSTIYYSGEGFLFRVNSLISDRLKFGNLAYRENGLSLWGRQLFLTMSERKTVGLDGKIDIDCAYVHILLRGGIIVYTLFSATYIYGMIKHARNDHYLEVCILFVLACLGAIELDLYIASINLFLLLLTNTETKNAECSA